jgi:CheY-like chemotaxis protein
LFRAPTQSKMKLIYFERGNSKYRRCAQKINFVMQRQIFTFNNRTTFPRRTAIDALESAIVSPFKITDTQMIAANGSGVPQLPIVMVIDDSMPDRFIADKIIKRAGLAGLVMLQDSARGALELLGNMREPAEVPSVIFLDIRMPDMDGFDFLNAFSGLPEHVKLHTQVVMLSSSSFVDDRLRAEAHSCVTGYISKPLTEKTLVTQCQQIANGRQ